MQAAELVARTNPAMQTEAHAETGGIGPFLDCLGWFNLRHLSNFSKLFSDFPQHLASISSNQLAFYRLLPYTP